MKELLENLEPIDNPDYLIDTCFFVWIFENNKEKLFKIFLEENSCAITSFNAEELVHISHKLKEKTKEKIRKFFHKPLGLGMYKLDVHPGNADGEHAFVKSILPELNKEEHDPSDAVILAAAIKAKADVLTRDKHHIFNVHMVNFLNDVRVLNTFPK